MDYTNEIWKCIPGFDESYQVSNMCRARSKKSGEWKLLSIYMPHYYPSISIRNNKKYICIMMHRAVYLAFKGNIPKGYDVDHINFDTTDCRPENLQLLTHTENVKRAITRKKLNGELTSKYEGVAYDKARNMYIANIRCKGHLFRISYKNEIDALDAVIFSNIGIFPTCINPETLIEKNKVAQNKFDSIEAKKEYVLKIKSREYKNAERAKRHSEMLMKKNKKS